MVPCKIRSLIENLNIETGCKAEERNWIANDEGKFFTTQKLRKKNTYLTFSARPTLFNTIIPSKTPNPCAPYIINIFVRFSLFVYLSRILGSLKAGIFVLLIDEIPRF